MSSDCATATACSKGIFGLPSNGIFSVNRLEDGLSDDIDGLFAVRGDHLRVASAICEGDEDLHVDGLCKYVSDAQVISFLSSLSLKQLSQGPERKG